MTGPAQGARLAVDVDEMRREGAVAKRPASELEDRVMRERELESERRLSASSRSPEELGEVDRELTMLRGALAGVQQRVAELCVRVEPVLRELPGPVPPQPFEPGFPVETDLGRRLADVRRQLGELEQLAGVTVSRLAV